MDTTLSDLLDKALAAPTACVAIVDAAAVVTPHGVSPIRFLPGTPPTVAVADLWVGDPVDDTEGFAATAVGQSGYGQAEAIARLAENATAVFERMKRRRVSELMAALAEQDDVAGEAVPLSDTNRPHDHQLFDAMCWLEEAHPDEYLMLLTQFPEWLNLRWSGGWLDTAEMRVHDEWPWWLTEAVEATGLVAWVNGEPWAGTPPAE